MHRDESHTVPPAGTALGGIRLQQLAYLDAVARMGRFVDAADEVGVSQPSLSQGLTRLEALLDVPLFATAGRTKTLTPAGREVAEFASRMIGEAHDLAHLLAARRNGRGGRLRVGMIDAVALYLRAGHVARFRNERPDVTLSITIESSGTLLAALEDSHIDAAIVVAPATRFDTEHLVTESLHVYHETATRLEDIERWVLYPTGSHTRTLIDAAFANAGLRPKIETESGNPSVMAQLVRMASGGAVLPAGIAEQSGSPLRRIYSDFAERNIVFATREGPSDPLTEAFGESLR